MRRGLLLLFLITGAWHARAQSDSTNVPNSANGWYLSPHGTIRVLVLFAEVVYDKNPAKDPQADGSDNWHKGQLPTWKDDLFDPQPSDHPKAMVTRYYHEMSLGGFTVLGDYVDKVIEVRESEHPNLGDWSTATWDAANQQATLHTAHGFGIADFDQWQDGGKAGLPKVHRPDDPHSYDHVMVILRNSSLTHGQGSTDAGSSGKLFGYPSDTQSRFGAMYGLPFEILKHEFNHMLLGGNNFHSGGGNAAQFASYFLQLQGGWSMMGAASSSLLTACAWDRDRLGWRPAGSTFRIRARNRNGGEVNGDLDPLAGDTGVFVLRDFVTSGDALRIRMPFLPTYVYPEWLWLENHQTKARNGSPTDKFHYEEETCTKGAVPGIYMEMQVDREDRTGNDIYGGNADYLRAVPASGNYDTYLRGDTVTYQCLWANQTQPYVTRDKWANPLTGAQDQELALFDRNGDGKLTRNKEGLVPRVEVRNGEYLDEGVFFGHSRHAFTPQGVHRLGMDTDPSSANMLTLSSNNSKEVNKARAPDVRTIYLNGISVELLEQRADGGITVRVRCGDTRVTHDVRWCADSIVLPPLRGADGRSLTLAKGVSMRIDRSRTPTRMEQQERLNGFVYFSGRTHFTISLGATMAVEAKASLVLENGSELHVLPGATLTLDPAAKLTIDGSSQLVVHGNAVFTMKAKTLRKLKKKGRVVVVP